MHSGACEAGFRFLSFDVFTVLSPVCLSNDLVAFTNGSLAGRLSI